MYTIEFPWLQLACVHICKHKHFLLYNIYIYIYMNVCIYAHRHIQGTDLKRLELKENTEVKQKIRLS